MARGHFRREREREQSDRREMLEGANVTVSRMRCGCGAWVAEKVDEWGFVVAIRDGVGGRWWGELPEVWSFDLKCPDCGGRVRWPEETTSS